MGGNHLSHLTTFLILKLSFKLFPRCFLAHSSLCGPVPGPDHCDTWHPPSMTMDSILPKGGFLCHCLLHSTMPCLLRLQCLPISVFLLLLDSGYDLSQSRSRPCCGGGLYICSHLRALSPSRAAPILTLSRPPNPLAPDSSKAKEVSSLYLFLPLQMATSGLDQILGVRKEELHMGWGRKFTFSLLIFPLGGEGRGLLMASPRLDQIARKQWG